MSGNTDWYTPRPRRADGRMRLVGIELEFTGLNLQEVTTIAAQWAGTQPVMHNIAQGSVATRWGKLGTEIDWMHLKTLSEEQRRSKPEDPGWLTLLRDLASVVVPTEVVLPPVPLDELHALEPLVEQLRAAGAKGTRHSPIAAYGVHLNPELPDLSVSTISAYLQAFGLLQWWLVERCAVDFTRRIVPYVDLYPEAYVLKILDYTEHTSVEELRDDYLLHNPTRNRALDLWPLLAHLDASWVHTHMDDSLVKARPTLHYRLANCEIDQPNWHLHSVWEPWRAVECLAADTTLLATAAHHFKVEQRPVFGASRHQWVQWVDQWLEDQSLA